MNEKDYLRIIEKSTIYRAILVKNTRNLKKMMISLYSFGFLIAVLFYFISDMSGIVKFTMYQGFNLLLIASFGSLSIFKKTQYLSPVFILVLDFYFVYNSLKLPKDLYVEFLLIPIIPIITYLFFKMRTAIILNWSLFVIFLLFFFPLNSILGFRDSENGYYFILLADFILVSIFSFYTSLDQNQHIQQIIKEVFFDKSTSLPDWNLLKLRIRPLNNEHLCLFRITNYAQIRKSSGIELSNWIFFKVKEKMLNSPEFSDLDVFKLRGEDFVFLWDSSYSQDDVQAHLNRIMDKFGLFSIRLNDSVVYIKSVAGSVSINSEIDETFQRAELAIEKAKIIQKSHSHISSTEKRESYESSADSFQKLVDALKNDRVDLHFQPIVDLRTDELAKMEALVRFSGFHGEIIPIAPLLKSAYSTGLNHTLTILILEKATDWSLQNNCNISVNIAYEDLIHPGVIEAAMIVIAKLDKKNLQLTLEILESSEIYDEELSSMNLQILRNRGALIAIDDFGAGYANFDRIFKLQPDIIKFDGSLIKELSLNEDARYLVSMVSRLAEKNGIKTVAEFVETETSLELVRKYGITYAQGYYFGKPSPRMTYIKNINLRH